LSATHPAWLVESVGTPWSLALREQDNMPPANGEVVVETAFSALNFADGLMLEGKYQVRPPLPFVPGHEFAGTVVHSACGRLPVGTQVAAQVPHGALAARVRLAGERCVVVPPGLGLDVAAAVLISYTTAHLALHVKARVQPGDTVLIHAAAGALGTAAAQLARAAGARVLGVVSSEEKKAVALTAGCDEVFLSGTHWASDVRNAVGSRGLKAVLDSVGGETTTRSLKLLGWGGTLLIVGFSSGEIASLPVNRLLLKSQDIMGVYWSFDENPQQTLQMQHDLLAIVASGQLAPVIDSVWPAAELEPALHKLMAGATRGKVLLRW
jgi:NADPH2:quinone reductase